MKYFTPKRNKMQEILSVLEKFDTSKSKNFLQNKKIGLIYLHLFPVGDIVLR